MDRAKRPRRTHRVLIGLVCAGALVSAASCSSDSASSASTTTSTPPARSSPTSTVDTSPSSDVAHATPAGAADASTIGDLYLEPQASITPVVTPEDRPITWGAAPPIDPNYGGTLYSGTGAEQQDPRPALDSDGNEPLRMWVADPHDGRTGRPAIIWIHGGGFAVGIDSMSGLAEKSGKEYAQRGYVGFSIEYRIDTTLIGNGDRPPSLCQWVQDNENPDDPVWAERLTMCLRNMEAATRDALAAVRYLRAHAAELGIDPDRIAVGGFSAGAVTASTVAYRSEDVGTHPYWPGDSLDPALSKVQATFGASGCEYTLEREGPISEIGPGDAPISLIHSRRDQAVDYSCVRHSVTDARSKGLVAELTSYCDSNLHADKLYRPNKAATDKQWTTFLARWLNLRTDVREPSADPVCPT